ncbi:MAG: hypothetical protein OXH08_00325 [Gammaproteobacteria bacterium]|nr:hypothetical protein [Gammaproteobacteria bacterium]MDE0649287.1 hypothetical protein [Gammaproteobacteria bacterium]
MNSNGRGHSYNWGLIIPVVLALIGGSWQLAVMLTKIQSDLDDIKADVGSISTNVANLGTNVADLNTNVAKLQVTVASMTPQREVPTLEVLRNELADLRVELQAAPTTDVEAESSRDPPIPDFLRPFCDGSEMSSELNIVLVGQTVNGALSELDEQLEEDETYFDDWILPICEPGTITVEMASDMLDSYIIFSSLTTLAEIGQDDDDGGGLDARLTADVNPGLYLILANTSRYTRARTGDYTLSVQR